MLDNIRSNLILKNVFTYLNIKTKLKIIYCNKKLHNKISISIDYFKYFVEKYIIYESKTKAKEYNCINDKLIYEGGYSKGKRNGQGKEYYLGNLIFEGEYLNGKRNGKGKEYHNNGKLKFEGEYLNGRRNGKGTEYYYNGQIKFEGDYYDNKIWNGIGYNKGKDYTVNVQNFLDYGNKNDIENNDIINQTIFTIKYGKGYVKEFDEYSKLIFEGEYINGVRNGKGKEYDYNNNNVIFEGEYINGKRNGFGKEYNEQGELIFQGDYKEGKKWNGKGEIKKINEKKPIIILYDLKEGQGYLREYEYQNYNIGKLISEIKYINGERNGKAKDYDSNGTLIFEGEYYNGRKKGKVKEYNSNGELKFEGEYLDGKKNGKGKEYDNYGKLEFEGEYLYGKKNGKGKEYTYLNENKLLFEGEYINDYKIRGKEYNLKDKLIYEGEYLFNKRTNGKLYEYKWYGDFVYELKNGKLVGDEQ